MITCNKITALAIFALTALLAVGCLGAKPPSNHSVLEKVETGFDVEGLVGNIKTWRDHRGVFFYVRENGERSKEPIYLGSEHCSGRHVRNQQNTNIKTGNTMVDAAAQMFMNAQEKKRQQAEREKRAFIELQCTEREKWEREQERGKGRVGRYKIRQ